MSKESPEFEVLLKHVDRAGTRAVDGIEEDTQETSLEKRMMKPEVMSPQGHPRRQTEPAHSGPGRLIVWPWLLSGLLIGLALTWWVAQRYY